MKGSFLGEINVNVKQLFYFIFQKKISQEENSVRFIIEKPIELGKEGEINRKPEVLWSQRAISLFKLFKPVDN